MQYWYKERGLMMWLCPVPVAHLRLDDTLTELVPTCLAD
jgi:hypothetical protein